MPRLLPPSYFGPLSRITPSSAMPPSACTSTRTCMTRCAMRWWNLLHQTSRWAMALRRTLTLVRSRIRCSTARCRTISPTATAMVTSSLSAATSTKTRRVGLYRSPSSTTLRRTHASFERNPSDRSCHFSSGQMRPT